MKIKRSVWVCILLLLALSGAYYTLTKAVENRASWPSSKTGEEIAKTCESSNERYVEGKLVDKHWHSTPADFDVTDGGAYGLTFDIKYTHNDFWVFLHGYKSELDKEIPGLIIGEKYAFCAKQYRGSSSFHTQKFYSLSE